MELSRSQRELIGTGYAGPPVALRGEAPLTEEQLQRCSGGLDERQLRMLKAQVSLQQCCHCSLQHDKPVQILEYFHN